MIVNSSIGYRGEMVVTCVPRGSAWSLTLSDVRNRRPAPATPGWALSGAFGDYPSYRHSRPAPLLPINSPEPVLIER